ncbi:carbohydrate ABC transporter permease [Paenibacillus sp. J5C_2022]|uniref:carbohydrate ABC transporter permease n=1 Tax=Paenibacillus sp. J5C2022 TaxID=2977129 RepID=UPI0021CF5070|nr:carbohydrate ABC transporter permease [Paenibacillus sp. J5C2022]MCU6711978.1 carbohydrate ABC transporter permease [Paenibacillus sp. J5C2022]
MTNFNERLYQAINITVVLGLALLSAIPLVYVISMSLVNEQEWIARGGFILWPNQPTLIAYERLFQGSAVIQALGSTVVRTVLGTSLVLTMTTIAAYVLSKKNLPGRTPMLFFILVTILINGGLIPTYLVVRDLHLLDSIWALIIPGLIDSWSVLVLKQFFENIPDELEESAVIDGAGEFMLMLKIMIPMAAPAMAAIGLFIGVAQWNSWFDALIYLNDPQWHPIQLLIRNMFSSSEIGAQFNNASQHNALNPVNRVSTESLKMALVVIGTLPIMFVYPFLQKHFMKGMYLGAVKG